MSRSDSSSNTSPQVDLALVLAVDCSSSVDAADFHFQMTGIADALRHPPVLDAILAGQHQRIAITVVQWSSRNAQKIAVPWKVLGTATDLEICARETEQAARQWLPGGTGLAAGLEFCIDLLLALPFAATRRVIDVSGDGEENEGGDVQAARERAAAMGLTINGLPILYGAQRIEAYYRDRVIIGPGAFVIPAADIRAFSSAMIQKLLREVQFWNV